MDLRQWMEDHHPRLIGWWDWPRYRLFSRCWAAGCGRLMALHSPWRLLICENTPMAVALTEQGEALADAMDREASHPPTVAVL